MRIGFGYDIHKLVKKRKMIIGGVEIPAPRGEKGYSDGDVLIHAIIDALLGATGSKDIGTYFPPGDPEFKNISSRLLLKRIMKEVISTQYTIINLDCTVILEKPKLKPHIEAILAALSRDMGIMPENIAVKAKTKEGVGKTGKGKAIEAYAIVLVEKIQFYQR